MVYGIPNFKLEKEVVGRRADLLANGGVAFHLNCAVGSAERFAALRRRHDAVLIATGVYKARDNKAPGVGLRISEERRLGTACFSTCSSRSAPYVLKNTTTHHSYTIHPTPI